MLRGMDGHGLASAVDIPLGKEIAMDGERRATLADLTIDRGRRPRSGAARWVAAGAAAVVVLAAAALWWLARSAAAEVTTATVRRAAAVTGAPGAAGTAVLDASGYVVARRRSTISSKVTGRIDEVLIEEGMRVEAGQPLARLDASQARAQLALAEAQAAAAERGLEETRVRLAEARLDLGRQERLVAEGISTPAIVDAARAEADSLAARLAVGAEELAVARRVVAVRRQDLDDTVLRAPFAGIVVSKDAQPGEMISPVSGGGGFTRTGLCTLVDMGSLEIEVDVSESFIDRVRPGQPVVAVLDAYPDWQVPAQVITTVPTADRQKATVKVRIGFVEIDERVLPEMGVKVRLLEPTAAAGDGSAAAAAAPPALLVPKAALRDGEGGSYLLVVVDERVSRRPVRAGRERGDAVEIESGVAAGERVVVAGPAELADGDRVEVAAGGRTDS
jgi:RND family efflux transporter MFP subunit